MIKNKDLIKIIGVGVIWHIASGFSVSFYASYLREELAFTFTVIAIITNAGSICRILVSPLLGKIADKYSFATSMTLSFAVVSLGFLAMCFTTPETRWLYLVFACLHAFAMAGINSGLMNLIYDYVAPEDRASAMGVDKAFSGILSFFATLVAGVILGNIQGAGGFKIFGITLYAQQCLSFISLVLMILLIIYMRTVIAPLKRLKESDKSNETVPEAIHK